MPFLALVLTLTVQLNPTLTPGVTTPITVEKLCATRWGHDRRFVTQAMKRHIAQAYGLEWAGIGKKVEFDHLIPRELGGADDILNLWPQPWPDAHKKDRLENRLHVLVCSGQLELSDAQQAIRSDWVAAYQRFVGK